MTRLLGILNVTPDSFSDGGVWDDTAAAIDRGVELRELGADYVDVGGESTRPGATAVDPEAALAQGISARQESVASNW